ncbi:RICIN domain-containing protein [Cellulomonas sp. Root137]|uniref:pectate lyase family protein n=1 Tax=Cellulomonas sp. Root137 TaxID=1736459 RepID=UPI0006F9CD48|nr:RICIN domain-containing protein [Cellulomonas sp. Root137]KQY41933.1 pectate lyase [Cellulomonas sp. Root137]
MRIQKKTRRFVAAVAAGITLALAGVTLAALPAQAATVDTSAWYVLVNRQSAKALEVRDFSTADGGMIQQWTRNDGNWQQFKFVDSGSGWYRLQNRHSGKVLDVWGWSTADGGEIRQYTDANAANQRFKLVDSEGGRVRLVNQNSGKAVTVTDRSTADGATITQLTEKNQYNQQWELVKVGSGTTPTTPPTTPPATGLVGWASQNGGTTGGGSGATTTVTSSSALSSALSGSAPVVRVQGTISCSGMLTVASNKTVLGASGAKIVGCGLNIKNAKNVIVRNLTFDDWDDDAINIETSTNIWIDRNTFLTGYDGSVDTKRGSDYVTISWNHFDGQDKNSLVGHSDDNGSQDRGKLRVTYHHNWFDGTNQRNPRVRFGNPVHVFNNLYSSVGSYGVASTMEGGVLVEGNYFENTDDTYHLGEGSSPAGTLVARNNHFVNSSAGQTGGSVKAVTYSYTLDTASSVKSIVSAGAGAR